MPGHVPPIWMPGETDDPVPGPHRCWGAGLWGLFRKLQSRGSLLSGQFLALQVGGRGSGWE